MSRATPARGASRGMPRDFLRGRLDQHRDEAKDSLRRLVAAPLSSLLTAAVIAIALALPAALQTLVETASGVAAGWDREASRISVFMGLDRDRASARELVGRIEGRADVIAVRLIPRDEALEEFREQSGLETALDSLEENPLPHTLVVQPTASSPGAISRLGEDLGRLDGVDRVRLDRAWLERLQALLATGERLALLLFGLLGVGVLLIVGNTIRLAIASRREEIAITQLIGATDAFIRRPFLYMGLWYGLFGGLLAVVLVNTGLLLLRAPVDHLAALYDSTFTLNWLPMDIAAATVGLGVLLGLAGAWFEVGRHLRATAPR